jgi:hypothetical protein
MNSRTKCRGKIPPFARHGVVSNILPVVLSAYQPSLVNNFFWLCEGQTKILNGEILGVRRCCIRFRKCNTAASIEV